MTQALPRYCPRCGAPLVTGTEACATCNLPFVTLLSRDKHETVEPTSAQEFLPERGREAPLSIVDREQDDQIDQIPTEQLGSQNNSISSTRPLSHKAETTFSGSSMHKGRKVGRKEILTLLLILLVVLGAILYAFAGLLGLQLPGFANIQPPITTTTINATVPYAGVYISVLTVQQSQRFINDPNSSSDGMIRLNLLERNQTSVRVDWSYATIARLKKPDRTLASPVYESAIVNIAPGTSQKSIVDFSVPMNIAVKQLTLVLGTPKEAQMSIPLVLNANVDSYQSKTSQLNGPMLYFGLNWTLTSATSSLGVEGRQAVKGMRFATLLLKVDNTLSQTAITGSPYEYMRLQYGNTSVAPEFTTIPVAFGVGAVGVTGTVMFEVPQQTSSFTLVLIPQKSDQGDQSSTDFHLS